MQDNTFRMAGKRQAGASVTGPLLAFAACVLTAFATLTASATLLPRDLALPLTSTLLFFLAGLVAIVGWRGGPASERGPVSYRDVAGALTFIGTFAASLIDPDQMIRVVEGTYRQN